MAEFSVERHELLFNVRRSRRYHLWRVRLLQRWNAIRMLLFLVSTSAVVAAMFGGWGQAVLKTLGIASVLFAASEMVLRLGPREIQHRAFVRQYVGLERDILEGGENLTSDQLSLLEAQYLDIEMEEPPVLAILNRLCHNEEVRARYPEDLWDEYLKPIPWLVAIWARVWYQMPAVKRAEAG